MFIVCVLKFIMPGYPSTVTHQSRVSLHLLTVILLIAAFGRISQLDAQNLWVDEGFTYYVTQQPDILPILSIDVHPPFYFLLVSGWSRLTGVSELALRYLSVLPGMVSVALVYAIGVELLRRRGQSGWSWLPVFAALLLALADIELDLAKEARMYTLHTCFAALSVLAYLRWWRTSRPGDALLLTLSTAALVYTNYLGIWTPLAVGLHALLFLRGRQRIQAVGLLVFAGLLFLPWLLLVGVNQLGNGAGAERADASSLASLRMYLQVWFGTGWALTLGLALLGTVRLLDQDGSLRLRVRPLSVPVLLVLWAVLPLAVTFIANTWFPVLAAHRISQLTPAVVLLIAFGLGNFRPPATVFMAIVIVVLSVTSVDVYRIKGPWRDYVQTIAPFVRRNDLVLMEIGGGDYMLAYYFDRLLPPTVDVRSLKRWREWTPDAYAAGLTPLLDQHRTVWLLQWSSDTDALTRLADLGFAPTLHRVTDHLGSRLESFRFDRHLPPPLTTFANGMILRDARFDRRDFRLDLFWSAESPPDADYTVSGILLDETGRLVAQHDAPPLFNERPTSRWQPGEIIFDPHPLQPPPPPPGTPSAPPFSLAELPPGRYTVGVVVYRWSPDAITTIPTGDGTPYLAVADYLVEPSRPD